MSFLSERITTILGVVALVFGTLAGSNQLPQPFAEISSVLAGVLAVILGKTHPGTVELERGPLR